jgi:hypothetical protein
MNPLPASALRIACRLSAFALPVPLPAPAQSAPPNVIHFTDIAEKTGIHSLISGATKASPSTSIRRIARGSSYLSRSDLRTNFGLGKSETMDLVQISWPSGTKQSFRNVPADKFYQITKAWTPWPSRRSPAARNALALECGSP